MSYVYDRDDYEEIYYQCLSVKIVEKKKKKKKKKKNSELKASINLNLTITR
jgi:predicted carbohydrate-binding protein with CBM5 and CBM33 domain